MFTVAGSHKYKKTDSRVVSEVSSFVGNPVYICNVYCIEWVRAGSRNRNQDAKSSRTGKVEIILK